MDLIEHALNNYLSKFILTIFNEIEIKTDKNKLNKTLLDLKLIQRKNYIVNSLTSIGIPSKIVEGFLK